MASTSKHTNRLANESSPYLLQHQHNPVDWYAWGPEAFEAARAQDKPIFLSVGYSTCYWCHVMERQSFENEAIAAEMNARFINIKVDREERPDVDQLYMLAVQALTQHGGWPMSVFLRSDLRPFEGGTYFPPEDTHGRPGFPTILRAVSDAYKNRRDLVTQRCDGLEDFLKQLAEPRPARQAIRIDNEFITKLVDRSTTDYDYHNGGFGGAPKFPRETLLELLLIHNRVFPNEQRMNMLRHTLVAMAAGGIRDHLGGGFHRYSTDAHWLVPHFEIMLYDNAMLGWVYTEAYRQTEELQFAHIARGIFDFVLREMTSPEGAFYTAMDAEVDAMEGKSYLWTREEVEKLLGEKFPATDVALFVKTYGLDQGPNFADPHHGNREPDSSILYLPKSLAEVAAEANPKLSRDELESRLAPMRALLKVARDKRKQPLLDTKIITSWNALMIRALAYAGRVLQDENYLAAASKAAAFIYKHHQREDGTLWRTSRDGKTRHDASLDDYAFLAQAMNALFDSGGNEKWSEYAHALTKIMIDRFGGLSSASPSQGEGRGEGKTSTVSAAPISLKTPRGLYFSPASATDVFVRQKVGSDSPLPAGAAIAVSVLLELNQPEAARSTLEVFAQSMQDNGEGMSSMIQAALTYLRTNDPIDVPAAPASEMDRPLSPEQIAASVVSFAAGWASPTELHLRVRIRGGYHINAHETGKDLIATRLDLKADPSAPLDRIEYPQGEERTFPFSDQPLRIYEKEFTIALHFKQDSTQGVPLEVALTFQACTETECLPPVRKDLQIARAE